MSTKLFTKEDDEEISLQSFDSTRSGASVEYERNHHGYTEPQCKPPNHVLFPVKESKRTKRVVQKKKRRIEPICLQQTFPDIRREVGICFSCNIMVGFHTQKNIPGRLVWSTATFYVFICSLAQHVNV
jgi:hypothetical protein